MKTKENSPSFDITLYLGSSLFSGNALQHFQNALARLAPEWASKLHLWRFREPSLAIDITREDAIERVMLSKGIERGELFRHLEKVAPMPDPERRLGAMELRGAYPGLTVVLGFDDWTFCPIGNSWNSPEASHRESAVRKHLGCQYFFDRESCDRETVSPFSLPKLNFAGKVEADVDLDGVIKRIWIKKS